MSALFVYPTHKNCSEVEEEYASCGFRAATYPGRSCVETESSEQNCWNTDADAAEGMGLPVVKTICPGCQHRAKCSKMGYLGELIAVSKAEIVLCTHKRVEFTGFKEMMKGRNYVSVHENPINLLRPAVEITAVDVLTLQYIVRRALDDPKFLDWFGDDMAVDDQGNRYRDEELAIRKERQYRFFHLLHDLTDGLVADFERASTTTAWSPQVTMVRPEGIERTIFRATRTVGAKFSGQPWRFLLAAASGELHSAAIIIQKRFVKGAGQDEATLIKRLIGFKDNAPAPGVTVWFNDATLERDRLQAILRCAVYDRTPVGRLDRHKKGVQILRDVTRNTSRKTFANVIRGVLADREFQRVGIIGHRPHLGVLPELGPEFTRRIVKSAYFGSGEDRSSNDWFQKCDLIVIAGTPRIPPAAIAAYLVQIGEVGAACSEPEWGAVYWWARTESGQRVRVETKAYLDETWQRGCRDLVRAQLVQAIGRGRGILESGCEVIVLTNDECGLPISDAGFEALNAASTRVMEVIRSLTMENSNKGSLEKSIVSTRQVAVATAFSLPQARELLRGLDRRGMVRKVGDRSGWALVDGADVIESRTGTATTIS